METPSKLKWVVGVLDREYNQSYLQYFDSEEECEIVLGKEVKELKDRNDEGEVTIMEIKKIIKVEPEWKKKDNQE